jgi:hypothetical protein
MWGVDPWCTQTDRDSIAYLMEVEDRLGVG